MNNRLIKHSIFLLMASVLLLACNSSRHYERDEQIAEDIYGDQASDSTQNLASFSWKELFTDPTLQALITESLQNNYDMQNAIENVVQAQSYFKQSKASQWPTLSIGADASEVGVSGNSALPLSNYEIYSLAANASWEVDIWGKMRTAKRAAYADMLGTDAAAKAVQTAVVSQVAMSYYTLMALDKQLEITQASVDNYAKLSETMKALKESGNVTAAAVVQSEAARYASEVTIPDIKQQIVTTESSLRILLGRTSGNIERSSLETQEAADMIEVGVPIQLLDNRPDVMQAEFAVMSAYEMVGNAKTYFYPSLTLSASGAGLQSTTISSFLDPDNFAYTLVGGLTAPLFNKRANRTRLEVAKSQKEQALNSFKLSLLTAGKEVTDALSQYHNLEDKMQLRVKQLDALDKSVNYTRELLLFGSATYTEVLDAEQSKLNAELGDVSDQLEKLNTVVSLYKALGGGWK